MSNRWPCTPPGVVVTDPDEARPDDHELSRVVHSDRRVALIALDDGVDLELDADRSAAGRITLTKDSSLGTVLAVNVAQGKITGVLPDDHKALVFAKGHVLLVTGKTVRIPAALIGDRVGVDLELGANPSLRTEGPGRGQSTQQKRQRACPTHAHRPSLQTLGFGQPTIAIRSAGLERRGHVTSACPLAPDGDTVQVLGPSHPTGTRNEYMSPMR